MIQSIPPVYGKDYAPGYSIFTRTDNNFLSEGIVWFESQLEAAQFEASHVMIVKDENTIIEATSPNIKETNIHEYFDNVHVQAVCREPLDIDYAAQQALKYGVSLEGRPYDFTGLLLGFPLMITTGLVKYFKFLRKWPLPMHQLGSRVCSAFVADCYKHTDRYSEIPLFKEWHVSRIIPNMLWNDFPYKPFKFYKRIL